MSVSMKCRVCQNTCHLQFSHEVLKKYNVSYFFCETCGFMQTETPYWLDEAYSNAIAISDTGLVHRNLVISKVLSVFLFFSFGTKAAYLDMAGGYGLLTRLMRDIGFNFFWQDKFCRNLMAQGFEAAKRQKFAAVTAFEMLEHIPNPISTLQEIFWQTGTRNLVFSTELFGGPPPEPSAWWYYSFETGQHISFFQKRTLKFIANQLKLNFLSNGSIHMFTERKLSGKLFQILTNYRCATLLGWVPKLFLSSKVMEDHNSILEKLNENRL